MKSCTTRVDSCEVCGNNNLTKVLNLGKHPMCDDLVQINDSRVCNEYPIEILYCKICQTAHQEYQVPKKDLFPKNYHYRSRFTADVLNGMKNLVLNCRETFGSLHEKSVLDIGCNDGSLLDFFREEGAITYGIEPTGACIDAAQKGHKTYNDYLSPELAEVFVKEHGNPDIITFTNVFAHIEDLQSVITALKTLMKNETKIVIENHYLGAVLKKGQFDTFYHEHPRTYSATSFVYMAKSLGLGLVNIDFPSRYGGNIRVYLGKDLNAKAQEQIIDVLEEEKTFFDQFVKLNENIKKWVESKKMQINKLVEKHGKLKAKAFPGRAAILVKMLELNESQIDVVFEKIGSLKVGHYLPGTRIPITDDQELFDLEDKTGPIINLAWHISNEIHGHLRNHGYTGEIIDIIDTNDFN